MRARAAILLAGLAGAAPARAAEDDGSPLVVAVFPLVTKGTLAEAMVDTIKTTLMVGPESDRKVTILTGTELGTLLRQNPLKAVSACERDEAFETCFAQLATDIGADRMIIGRLRTDPSGVVVLLLAISSSGAVESRVRQTVAAADELARVLDGPAIAALFGVPWVAPPERQVLEPPEPPPVLPLSEPEAPAAAQAAPTPEDPLAQLGAEPAAAGGEAKEAVEPDVEIEPAIYAVQPRDQEKEPKALDAEAAVAAPLLDERAVAEAARVDPLVTRRGSETPWVRVAGVVGGGAGVVTLVVATVLAIHYDSLRVGLKPGTGLSQREAADRYRSANDTAAAANVLFFLGSAALAGGTSLVAYDLLADARR